MTAKSRTATAKALQTINDDELFGVVTDLEPLVGQIAAVVTMFRGIDLMDAESEDTHKALEALNVDWTSLRFFAHHLESLTDATLYEHVLPALWDARKEQARKEPR
jgi:hypothetical protein